MGYVGPSDVADNCGWSSRLSGPLVWFVARPYLIWKVFLLGFPGGSAGKESACNVGDLGSVPGLGRSPGEGKGYPLQYSGLENSPWSCRESDTTEQNLNSVLIQSETRGLVF